MKVTESFCHIFNNFYLNKVLVIYFKEIVKKHKKCKNTYIFFKSVVIEPNLIVILKINYNVNFIKKSGKNTDEINQIYKKCKKYAFFK